MQFQGKKHRDRFNSLMEFADRNALGEKARKYEAAAYLMTADESVWRVAQFGVSADGFDFGKMPIEDVGVVGYTLIKCAEDMWFGTGYTTLFDLCETEELDTRKVSAILSAVTIYRYGFRYNDGVKVSPLKDRC